jgi:predicted PolB exonuclease-like 3'-5' exonuclease
MMSGSVADFDIDFDIDIDESIPPVVPGQVSPSGGAGGSASVVGAGDGFDPEVIPNTPGHSGAENPVIQPKAESVTITAEAGVLYFDIETIPDYDRQHLFGLPPLPVVPDEIPEDCLLPVEEFLTQTLGEIDAWFARNNPCYSWLQKLEDAERKASGKKGNRKGLFDAIAKSRSARNATSEALAANRKKMSVTPEMCRIVALGLATDDSPPQTLVVGIDGVTEIDLLNTFWAIIRKCDRVCGFNVEGFDLPTIFVRSMLLGVPASKMIDTAPHRGQVLDLMARRFGRYPEKGQGLKQLCKLLGIEIPAEGMDGGQVEEVFANNPHMIAHYVASDVLISRKLHRLGTGYFWN